MAPIRECHPSALRFSIPPSVWSWVGIWWQMPGRKDPIFSCPFSAFQGRRAETQRNTEGFAQPSMGEYGKHCRKTSASTVPDTSKHEGREPCMPSCSSLNCHCLPECPSCKHLSEGVERELGKSVQNQMSKSQPSLTFALFTVSGERVHRVIQSIRSCLVLPSDGLHGEGQSLSSPPKMVDAD